MDIIEGLIAINIKAAQIKLIEIEMKKPVSDERIQALSDQKAKLLQKKVSEIVYETKGLLIKLGEAIFTSNDNVFNNFQNLREDVLRDASERALGASEEEINLILD